jgi:hypothetical protein
LPNVFPKWFLVHQIIHSTSIAIAGAATTATTTVPNAPQLVPLAHVRDSEIFIVRLAHGFVQLQLLHCSDVVARHTEQQGAGILQLCLLLIIL